MDAVKVIFNMSEELIGRLQKEAERLGISMTEAIRRCVETDLYLSNEEAAGSKILIEKQSGKFVQLIRR